MSKILYVIVGLVCINLRGQYSPIYLAMIFEYLQHISWEVNGMMHAYKENERNLKALQRLLKLDDIAQEQSIVKESGEEITVPESWPEKGELEFKDVEMSYRPETDLVLKGLSYKVKAGEKVGVVGRTGAGKSTMGLVISRICEIRPGGGKVTIDGIDTSRVNL